MALKVSVKDNVASGVVVVAGRTFSNADEYVLYDGLGESLENKIKKSPFLKVETISQAEHDKLKGIIEEKKAKASKRKVKKAKPKEETPKVTKE